MSEEKTVTPVEEIVQQDEETDTQTEESTETNEEATETDGDEASESSEESDEVDYKQRYESIEKELRQLREFVVSQREENNSTEEDLKVTDDAKELLEQFANNPKETMRKIVESETQPYKRALLELQQQQAIDYIRSQKDFSEQMYSDLTFIIEGSDRNSLFQYNGVNVKLKDLPPRQKAEAAIQILRARNNSKQENQNKKRLKPVTTTKAKSTNKSSAKDDSVLSAEDFAKKYGIKQGSF